MSRNFVQSAFVRDATIRLYRTYARSQFWRTGPRIFVNSMPKAGTHLLTQILETVPSLMNSRLHIETRSIGRRTGDKFEFDPAKFTAQLRSIRHGQFASGHLPFSDGLDIALTESGFATVNLFRSPRDMLVSRYFYILGLRRHLLHDHLTENYPNKKSMIIALIEGPKKGERNFDGRFSPYADLFRAYARWISAPDVLSVRYEDLVGPRGGGDGDIQLSAFSRLCRHLHLPIGAEALLTRWREVQHHNNPTLRNGKIGDWVNHFDSDIERVFQQHMGDLQRMYDAPDGPHASQR